MRRWDKYKLLKWGVNPPVDLGRVSLLNKVARVPSVLTVATFHISTG